MNPKLIPYNNTLWLCDPSHLQRLAIRAASVPTCPTARELVERRREWEEKAAETIDGCGDGFADGLESALDAASVGIANVLTPKDLTPAQREKMRAEWQAFHNSQADGEIVAMSGVDFKRADAPRAIRAVGQGKKIGVIPVWGPVDQRMTAELDKAGGTPLDFVSRSFDAMMANAAVGAIVMHIDSPGGSVYGTQELADKIYNARGEKPVYAIADSMAASAAYWIATSASMLICTPGGDVGSVGVYCLHVDESKALEMEGLSVTFVSAGKHKVELASTSPLSVEAKAHLQESVDATYDKFVGAVARNRGVSVATVRDNYGQGRVIRADKALAAGMIDRILTFEELLSKLVGQQQSSDSKAKASAEVLRLRHQHRVRMAK
jgi:signal peptide peptidase SppA